MGPGAGLGRPLERRNTALLLGLLPRLVDRRGLVLLADPGRAAAGPFIEHAEAEHWQVKATGTPRSEHVTIYRLRREA